MTSSAASIFNHLILSYIIFTFNKLNLFPRLAVGISLQQLLEATGYDPLRLQTMLDLARDLELLQQDQLQLYRLTELGRDLQQHRGFFTWAIGGYSPLLENIDTFLTVPTTSWSPYVRGDYVAIGSDEANQGLMQSIFDQVIDELPVTHVADLGCGNAGRLINLLQRHPHYTGVGIDIAPQAIDVAAANRDQHQLSPNRLQLICENVFDSLARPHPEFERIELVMSFMMLHDLFNLPDLQPQLFAKLKAAFPRAKYFVLADTCLSERAPSASMPIFTAGYELIHALRGIQLFPLRHYEERFAAAGLKLLARHDFGVPNTHLFVLENRSAFIQTYFPATANIAQPPLPTPAPLHRNELAHDLPPVLKDRLIDHLRHLPLNRYPEPAATSLVEPLADWYGCAPSQLLVGPGSSAFIRLLLTYFGLHMKGKLVLARPSFIYFEQFCQAYGVAYDTWDLSPEFSYLSATLADLPDYSVVCLTSPNNPTGTTISVLELETLLRSHPTSLFVVDEAYAEFTSQQFLPLLSAGNLLLLRTFSKAMGLAGIRCGALIGDAALVQALADLQTPWQTSSFTIEAAKLVLEYARYNTWFQDRVQEVITERERLRQACIEAQLQPTAAHHFVIPASQANFLLYQGTTPSAYTALLAACAQGNLLIEDLSNRPRLASSIRVSIGLPEHNSRFLRAFQLALARP